MSDESGVELQPAMPDVVRLTPKVDADAVLAEIKMLRAEQASGWRLQNTFVNNDELVETDIDWHALPLRSVGGHKTRTDPGGPNLERYADTEYAPLVPYLHSVLKSIPGPLRTARLMALGKDTYGPNHFDNKYSIGWGIARLHLPVITLPEAVLIFGDNTYVLEPGSLWFGNFTRSHRVENSGTFTRVHLMTDVLVTDELLEWFPADVRAVMDFDNILVNREEQPLRPGSEHQVAFEVPKSFTDWEEEDGQFLTDQPAVPAEIKILNDDLVLHYDGAPYAALDHIGDNEFRFVGWTDERTVQIVDEAGQQRVVLRTRVGKRVRSLAMPATPLSH